MRGGETGIGLEAHTTHLFDPRGAARVESRWVRRHRKAPSPTGIRFHWAVSATEPFVSVRSRWLALLTIPNRASFNFAMSLKTPHRFSRQELYDLVWSEPLLKLSRRFGLSDNGLRKRCKAMNVPTPAPGYWQRLATGRRVKRAPLPPLPG